MLPGLLAAAGLSAAALSACGDPRGDEPTPTPSSGGAMGSGGDEGASNEGGWGGDAGGPRVIEQPVRPSFQAVGVETECTFELSVGLATEMPTVGVVTFRVSGLVEPITGAVIQFGPSEEYGLEAPVDLAAADFRTLLLGMKPGAQYHYRIGASSGTEYCWSDDAVLTSRGLRAGIQPLADIKIAGTPTPGFVVGAQGSNAVVFDKDGTIVWGYSFQRSGVVKSSCGGDGSLTRVFAAKLSYDGRFMLARDLGPFDCGDGGTFYRVALDGTGAQAIELPGGDHHDFTVTPFGIAYIAKTDRGGYDKVFVAASDGSHARELVDLRGVLDVYPKGGGPGLEKSHFNVIHYWADRDMYTVSNRESDAIVAISSDGELLRGIGKSATASFETILAESTVGMTEEPLWRVQHGHDWYAPDKLLIFSNGDFVGGQAHALHYTVGGDGIARLDWSYSKMGNSATQGDIQMLPDGHVLVCASNGGFLQEIDAEQELVAHYKAPAEGFGYVMQRPSLYGAPPDGR